MTLNELVSKYISSGEHVFKHMEIAESPITLDFSQVSSIIDFAKAYL